MEDSAMPKHFSNDVYAAMTSVELLAEIKAAAREAMGEGKVCPVCSEQPHDFDCVIGIALIDVDEGLDLARE